MVYMPVKEITRAVSRNFSKIQILRSATSLSEIKRKNKQEQKVWLATSSPGRLSPALEGGEKRPRDEVVWIAQQIRMGKLGED